MLVTWCWARDAWKLEGRSITGAEGQDGDGGQRPVPGLLLGSKLALHLVQHRQDPPDRAVASHHQHAQPCRPAVLPADPVVQLYYEAKTVVEAFCHMRGSHKSIITVIMLKAETSMSSH